MVTNAPLNIIVFAYVRPTHLKDCLDALSNAYLAKQANLIICIDGLKPDVTEDRKKKHAQTIAVAKSENRFATHRVIVNETNFGVGKQYFDKFDLLLKEHEQLVVVEDDVNVGKHFLEYMRDVFARYGRSSKIALFVGYMYYIPLFKKRNSCFFGPGGGNQAFGITKTTWGNIDKSCTGYEQLKYDKQLRKRFNANGFDYASALIDEIENERNDAWDVIVYWNVFKKGLLCLYPDYSLGTNTGWGSEGATHTFIENPFEQSKFDADYKILNFPDTVTADNRRYDMVTFYLKHLFRFKFHYIKLKGRVKKLLP